MLDCRSREAALPGPTRSVVPHWPFAVMACAGLMGAAGVAIGAAGAHVGGGDLARPASDFLLIHAAAVTAGSAVALGNARRSALLAVALTLLTGGAILFGGALALAGLVDWRPWPSAAPFGGMCLIAGWLVLATSAARAALQRG